MADLEEIIEIRELPTKDSPSDSDYLVVDDETLTNRVKYSNFKSSMTKDVEEKIEQEINDRKSADNTLQSNIDTEVNNRKSVDTALQGNIDKETKARESADTTLQTNIDNEVKTRQNADNTLQTNIDNETKSRQSADETLQENIDNEKSQRLLNVDSLRTDINKCKKVFEYLNPTDTTYLIRHDLSTKDFLINVYSINGKDLNPTIERLDGDNVQLTFEEVPSDFRVVIFAINEWMLNKLAFNLPI